MRTMPLVGWMVAGALLGAGCCFQGTGEGTSGTGGGASGTAAATGGGTSTGSGSSTGSPTSGGGSSSTGGSTTGGPPPAACQLTLAPTELSFGNVAPGSSATLAVSVTDSGPSPCDLSNVALAAGSDPGFALSSPAQTSFLILPGATISIGVSFAPDLGAGPPLLRQGTLLLQPGVSVPLKAYIAEQVCYCPSWPKWHMDNDNSGTSLSDTSWLQGSVAWKAKLGTPGPGQTYLQSPIIDDFGNVYQVDAAGTLHAFDPGGSPLWTASLGSSTWAFRLSTPLLFQDDTMAVVAGAGDGGAGLYLLDHSGNVQLAGAFAGDDLGSWPNVSPDGTLFVAQNHPAPAQAAFGAVAFQRADGGLVQVAELPLPVPFTSARSGVVVANDGSTYWANDGQLFGVTPLANGFVPMPAWPDGGVALGGPPGGSVPANSELALDEGNTGHLYAYVAWESGSSSYSVQGLLAALDPATGAIHWTVALPATPLPAGWQPLLSDSGNAAPAIAPDGTVYVGNGDGLRALDGATGKLKWLFPSANVSSAPAVGGDGTVFFGVDDGTLYAVHPDGSLRFALQTGGPISSSPAINSDGTVVFVSDDGWLYAVH